MAILNLKTNTDQKVYVKPDQATIQIIYTGATTNLLNIGIGEGLVYAGMSGTASLIKTLEAGQNITIENLSDRIRINAGAADYVLITDFEQYTGDTQTILTGMTESISELESGLEGHTFNADIHFEMSGITITENQISNLGDYALETDFTGHTSNTAIHYPMSGISILYSQITNPPVIPTIPTNVGDFNNDVGYITASDIPTNVSSFTNDANYIVSGSNISQLVNDSGYIVTSDIPTIVGSGDTTVTLSGNTYTIYSEAGDEAAWGNISGTLSNQTDLQSALDEKTNQVDFTGHTSNTDIHFPMSGISITESQISDLGTYTPLNSFTAHTQDNTIHFTQAQISITESQISDLGVYATQTDFTGHTQDSSIHFTEASISLDYDTQLTGKPSLGSIAGFDLWQGTQGQYDALGTYDNMTIYLIEE